MTVKKITQYTVEITDGISNVTLGSNYNLSDLVFVGPAVTVIAAYVSAGKLYPLTPDLSLETDDLQYLSNAAKGKIFSHEKIARIAGQYETAVSKLKEVLNQYDLSRELGLNLKNDSDSDQGPVDLSKL